MSLGLKAAATHVLKLLHLQPRRAATEILHGILTDTRVVLRMDMGFRTGIIIWTLLQSLYTIHFRLTLAHVGVRFLSGLFFSHSSSRPSVCGWGLLTEGFQGQDFMWPWPCHIAAGWTIAEGWHFLSTREHAVYFEFCIHADVTYTIDS